MAICSKQHHGISPNKYNEMNLVYIYLVYTTNYNRQIVFYRANYIRVIATIVTQFKQFGL